MADVFISYSRRDQAFVRRLHAALKEAGREIWVTASIQESGDSILNADARALSGNVNGYATRLTPTTVGLLAYRCLAIPPRRLGTRVPPADHSRRCR